MYLADNCGWPLERRKGRPVHNFVRACVLVLRGQIWFRRGQYDPRKHGYKAVGPIDEGDMVALVGTHTGVAHARITHIDRASGVITIGTGSIGTGDRSAEGGGGE